MIQATMSTQQPKFNRVMKPTTNGYSSANNTTATTTSTINPGKGTTHKIREQLNFTDEKRWKQFSCRRLELIDKFGLSERKASEQDSNIKQIANMLRLEFNYSQDSINEFEKLVTAAVQSVRRNRKRSKKRYNTTHNNNNNNNNNNNTSTSTTNVQIINETGITSSNSNSSSSSSSNVSSPRQVKNELYPISTISNGLRSPLLSPPSQPLLVTSNSNSNSDPSMNKIVSLPIASKFSHNTNFASTTNTTTTTTTTTTNKPSFSLSTSSSTSNSSLHLNPINNLNTLHSPLPTRRQVQMHTPPQTSTVNNKILPPVQDHSLLSMKALSFEMINLSKLSNDDPSIIIPIFLLNKIIEKIQNSRTFIHFINISNWSTNNLERSMKNLEILGEMSTKASISFVMEKYFNNTDTNTTDDTDNKFSFDFLRQLSICLFNKLDNFINLDFLIQIKFLYFIIGAIVKDYGFDSSLYPLNEIIHHLIQHNNNNKSNTTVLPPLNNGLNILSVVSSQVENDINNTSNEYTHLHNESLPSVTSFLNNNNTSTSNTKSVAPIQPGKGPLPPLIIKESFANGTLPQPIQQI